MRCKTSDPVPTRGHSPPGVPSCGQCTHAAGPRASPSRAWKERSQVPACSSPTVFSLPAGAPAGRDLCLDQAVVLIEDAIQVGGTCSWWLGLGLSLGLGGDWVMAAPRALHASPSWAGAGVVGLCGHCDHDDWAVGAGQSSGSLVIHSLIHHLPRAALSCESCPKVTRPSPSAEDTQA